MFCGFPVIVPTLPIFDAIATARRRNGVAPQRPRHLDHQRRHDQAYGVIDQERRERTGGHRDGNQQNQRRMRMHQRPACHQSKKTRQPQVRHHDHHAEQRKALSLGPAAGRI
jgi:hypothetical protein